MRVAFCISGCSVFERVLLLGVLLTRGLSATPFAERPLWRLDAALEATQKKSQPDGAASREEFPSVVSLQYAGETVCTGVLIAPSVVLTARHCLGVTFVAFGADGRAPTLVRRIASFTAAQPALDAALLFLDIPVTIKPIELRAAGTTRFPAEVSIVGFGHERRNAAGVRRILETRIRGWGCTYGNRSRLGCVPDFEMVFPRSQGADTCSGDSGGPVLERLGSRWQIVAITSRGVQNSMLKCGDGGIYTRVDAIGAWIERAMAQEAQRRVPRTQPPLIAGPTKRP